MTKAVRWLDAKLSYPTGPSQRTTMNWIEEVVAPQESRIVTFRAMYRPGGHVLEGYRLKDCACIRTETALAGGIATARKRMAQEKR